jgi:hypothetical protein
VAPVSSTVSKTLAVTGGALGNTLLRGLGMWIRTPSCLQLALAAHPAARLFVSQSEYAPLLTDQACTRPDE